MRAIIMPLLCESGWRSPADASSCISSPPTARILNPIERLWGVMHRSLTHNRTYPTYREFADAMLHFLRAEVPSRWREIAEFNHRQLPHNPPCQFSYFGVSGVSHPPSGALSIRVYYEDTDFSGRVYHASYLRFLERGRTEWLREHGFAQRDFAESSGVFFAVRSLQIDYLAPAIMDDMLSIETSVSAVRGASIEFRQRIVRHGKELVAARCWSRSSVTAARREFPLPCAVSSLHRLDA